MQKAIFLVLLLAVSSLGAVGSSGFEEEDDVIVLTDATYEEAIKKFPFILVEFYAPWCGHCKKLAPEFSAAAKTLKGLETVVPLAKVDSTVHKEAAKKNDVSGYPTLKFFVDGVATDFNGGRTAADIVTWIKKKTGPAIELIKTAGDLSSIQNSNEISTVFFGGEDHESYSVFKSHAVADEKLSYFQVTDPEMIKANGGNVVTLFTKFDNGVNHHPAGKITSASIKQLIENNRYPPVMEFEGDGAIERIFTSENPAVVLFSDKDLPLHTIFEDIAKADTNEKKIAYCRSKVTSGLGKRLAEYIGLDAKETPAVWIIEPKGGNVEKFILKKDLTAENIEKFISDWRTDSLEKIYKSAPIPEKNDEPVKVLVGKNFDDLVINNENYVLVKFYAPWCGHCKKLAPIYDEFAEKFSHIENLVVAKLDSTENEIPGINISGFPTLKWFVPGKKSEPVDFTEERTLEGLTKWIKDNMGDSFSEGATEEDL